MDKGAIRAAYEDVRNDHTDTTWSTFKYEGKEIVHEASGDDFSEFKTKFSCIPSLFMWSMFDKKAEEFLRNMAEDRGFGYLRVATGDELSKRSKFVLISWCGNEVGGLKRARLGTDKSELKQLIKNFAIELQLSEQSELNYNSIAEATKRAGGANYGTGR